ncbi:hypothetical protein GCM10009109_00480 [Marinobacterium sediminicola]
MPAGEQWADIELKGVACVIYVVDVAVTDMCTRSHVAGAQLGGGLEADGQ